MNDIDKIAAEAAAGEDQANVHIEHYFPKGYSGEPWESIKRHHYAALRAQQQELTEAAEPKRYHGIWRQTDRAG